MTLHPSVLRVLDEVELVSLDVFDTSIHRAVLDPADLFALVPERVPECRMKPASFRRLRRSAEGEARNAAPSHEPTFEQIVSVMAHRLASSELAGRLGQCELDLELELVRASEPGCELATEALRRGKRLVYTSDMYLSSAFMSALLMRADLPSAPVFVSNEHGTSKAVGGLFTNVARWASIPPHQCLHVGDDPVADHGGARRAGMRTVDVAKPAKLYRGRGERFAVPRHLTVDDSLALGLAAPALIRAVPPMRANKGADRLEAIGVGILGPTVLAFASWVADQAERKPAPILFCARDGLLPLECYRRFADRWGVAVPGRYFHVSRRSVGVPSLAGGLRHDHKDLLCGGRHPRSAAQLFARVGLERPLAEDAARRVGGPPVDVALPPGEARDVVFEMFAVAEEALLEVARVELDGFGQYWCESGLDGFPDVSIVDVGWRATVQRALQHCLQLLGQPTRCRGLYLALLDHGPLEPGSASGMLVDHGQPLRSRLAIEAGVPIVELMFQADHGSVERYECGQPVLEPEGRSRDVVDPIQRGARAFLDEVDALDRPLRPSAVTLRPLLRLLNQPRPTEAGDLGRFAHSDGLADDANAEPILIDGRGDAPSKLQLTASTVRANEWRPGLLALNLRSPHMRRAGSLALTALKAVGYVASRRRAKPLMGRKA